MGIGMRLTIDDMKFDDGMFLSEFLTDCLNEKLTLEQFLSAVKDVEHEIHLSDELIDFYKTASECGFDLIVYNGDDQLVMITD